MPNYRKKPVIIEAKQLTEETFKDVMDWVSDDLAEWCWDKAGYMAERYLLIKTLEGNHKAQEYDYIIKGVKGEFYPCKPDIFKMTYEEVA